MRHRVQHREIVRFSALPLLPSVRCPHNVADVIHQQVSTAGLSGWIKCEGPTTHQSKATLATMSVCHKKKAFFAFSDAFRLPSLAGRNQHGESGFWDREGFRSSPLRGASINFEDDVITETDQFVRISNKLCKCRPSAPVSTCTSV